MAVANYPNIVRVRDDCILEQVSLTNFRRLNPEERRTCGCETRDLTIPAAIAKSLAESQNTKGAGIPDLRTDDRVPGLDRPSGH